jgi:hypothetical protein
MDRAEERLDAVEERLDHVEDILSRDETLVASTQRLSGTVGGLSDVLKGIRENKELLHSARREIQEKASSRFVRVIASVGAALMVAAAVYVGYNAADVRRVAREECQAANARLESAISRERALADTDVPDTRDAHRRSAEAMTRQLRQCR